ncbi:hypothetical protein MD484_g7627, partial [Candolleomyces efflorescens]
MQGKGKAPQRPPLEPGRKTPRRIQWLDEETNGQDRTRSPVHILDPSGQDPEAFNALRDALQKHRDTTHTATPLSKIHYYSPRSAPKDVVEDYDPNAFSSDDGEDDQDASSTAEASGTSSPTPLTAFTLSEAELPEDVDSGWPRKHDSHHYAKRQAKMIVRTHTQRLAKGQPIHHHRMSSAHHHRQSRLAESYQPIDDEDPYSTLEKDDRDLEGDDIAGDSSKGILSTLLGLYEAPSGTDTPGYVSSFASSTRGSPSSDNGSGYFGPEASDGQRGKPSFSSHPQTSGSPAIRRCPWTVR